MAPREGSKFGAPMFESVFSKQMYCIEESASDIVGTFRRPMVIRRAGNCSSFALHRYAPGLHGRMLICHVF